MATPPSPTTPSTPTRASQATTGATRVPGKIQVYPARNLGSMKVVPATKESTTQTRGEEHPLPKSRAAKTTRSGTNPAEAATEALPGTKETISQIAGASQLFSLIPDMKTQPKVSEARTEAQGTETKDHKVDSKRDPREAPWVEIPRR